LFIIAAELLSALLRQREASFSQPEGGPRVHHLAFADDLIVFTSGKGEALQGTMKTIKDYESVSGQLVNKKKSAFYVHMKTPGEVIRRVGRITGYQNKEFPFIYLGCPIYVERKRVTLFANLISKMARKCSGWQNRMLTKGGKAVLIKSILQSMPVHLFSALNPPKTVIKKVEKILTDFFWGMVDGKTKYHWGSWKSLAKPTEQGGVGFTRLEEVVAAAGARLWWNFREGNSVWSRFMKAKYCKRVHPICKTWQYGDSHVWRRMMEVREWAEKEIEWKVGAGDLNVWWDNWTGEGAVAEVMSLRGKRQAKKN